jgi:hypothetical protein
MALHLAITEIDSLDLKNQSPTTHCHIDYSDSQIPPSGEHLFHKLEYLFEASDSKEK